MNIFTLNNWLALVDNSPVQGNCALTVSIELDSKSVVGHEGLTYYLVENFSGGGLYLEEVFCGVVSEKEEKKNKIHC